MLATLIPAILPVVISIILSVITAGAAALVVRLEPVVHDYLAAHASQRTQQVIEAVVSTAVHRAEQAGKQAATTGKPLPGHDKLLLAMDVAAHMLQGYGIHVDPTVLTDEIESTVFTYFGHYSAVDTSAPVAEQATAVEAQATTELAAEVQRLRAQIAAVNSALTPAPTPAPGA